MIPVIVLFSVFILIAIRRIGKYRFQIWQIMLLGALTVMITLQINPLNALKAINADVILFLFGVFVIGEALEDSGYLPNMAARFFSKAKSLDTLVLFILLGAGAMSAFLMNDTLAIIGTPVVLLITRNNNGTSYNPKMLLLTLAFAVTIGSVASPIGNPQNLLIAINGNIANPFVTFFKFLLFPTIVNLFLAYLMIRLFFRKQFDHKPLTYTAEPVTDSKLAGLAKISLIILITLVVVKIILVFTGVIIDFRLTYIALAAASPILLISPKRFSVVKRIDWSTLIFFAALFILMQSVWDSGFFQSILNGTSANLTSNSMVLVISVILSEFISNVPMVALYLPVIVHAGATTTGLMALAAGSTIAGNLTILGAASNVIIIQNAEKKGHETLTFFEFIKVGAPLTVINILVYWLFFQLF